MESSEFKVTPKVFITLENGMDASPTERQSTWTVSVLGGIPQGVLPFFVHLASVCFSSSILQKKNACSLCVKIIVVVVVCLSTVLVSLLSLP